MIKAYFMLPMARVQAPAAPGIAEAGARLWVSASRCVFLNSFKLRSLDLVLVVFFSSSFSSFTSIHFVFLCE